MKRIAHISDLHFGRDEPRVCDGLVEDITAAAPALVVVSGDITQRARRHEFAAAAAFLERLPFPTLVVPGNHDIPLYNVVRRVLAPLSRFQGTMGEDLWPESVDDDVAVLGVNTAHGLTVKGGRLTGSQLDTLCARMSALTSATMKVLVTHHPLLHPEGWKERESLRGSARLLDRLRGCGVDVMLAGHLHVGWSSAHPVGGSVLLIQAGTATSTRERGEPNSYNVVTVERDAVQVDVRSWGGREFATVRQEPYLRREGVWQRA